MQGTNRAIAELEKQANDKQAPWIRCSDMLPEDKQLVWVSVKYQGGKTESVEGIFINGELCRMNGIGLGLIAEAWMPRYIPVPYIGEQHEG